MFEELIGWFRILRHIRVIVRDHEVAFGSIRRALRDLERLPRELRDLERILRERTDVSADIGFDARAGNHIIVVGRYRNRDYVQVYTVRTDHLAELIDHLRDMQRHGSIRTVDAPVGFRAVFDREPL